MTTDTVRVAIVGDTHGRLDARIAQAVASCDYAVHAGDIGAVTVLDALRPHRGKTLAVRGNNDVPAKWIGAVAALDRLPEEGSLGLPGGTLVVVHGDRAGRPKTRHATLRRMYPRARAVVYGHSHRLVVDTDALPWVLNPGAAGRARTYGGPSCLVLVAGPGRWQVDPLRF